MGGGDTERADSVHLAGTRPRHQPQRRTRHPLQENQVTNQQAVLETLRVWYNQDMIMTAIRFGNGQFACLILCLTMTDLVTTVSGLVGGLVLELGDM